MIQTTRRPRSIAISLPRRASASEPVGPYPRRLDLIDPYSTAVQRAVRRTGLSGYEPATQAALLTVMQRAGDGAVFFDIGAHIGLYSAMIACVFRSRGVRVVAFEPAPETARICVEVRDRNSLDYEVVTLAVCDRESTATLYLSDKAETSNSMNPTFRPSSRQVHVETTTLDAFVAARGIAPTLIKIDVETLEPAVLAGARAVVRGARPWIVCELLGRTEDLVETLRDLADEGYQFYRLDQTVPWRPRAVGDVVDLLTDDDRDWLFSPQPLDDEFQAAASSWLDAVAACDAATNVVAIIS